MKATNEFQDENNNETKLLVESFDREPGFYQLVMRPMLAPGHEVELITWIKSSGLIPHRQVCNNSKANDSCNRSMEWIPAKVVDYFQWKCRNCMEKKSIRENSVFSDVKCSFKNSMRIVLGWCKSYHIEMVANLLGVKKQSVRVLYSHATTVAKKFLKSPVQNRHLGGEGVIVIIDIYPEGCANHRRPVRGNRPILCIAEAKNIPPSYWFEALDRYSRANQDQINNIKEHILRTIQDLVLPGSILVARLDSALCSYYDLQKLSTMYPVIVSVEGLARHDCISQTICNNLDTIWKLALDICEEAQFFTYEEVPNFLLAQMWQNRFGLESFEMLLNQFIDTR